jgi:hypothetical protein
MDKNFDRCPRCRKKLNTFAVFECPSCATLFCVGCNDEERPAFGMEWLTAAVAESAVKTCPACTERVDEMNQVGTIVAD